MPKDRIQAAIDKAHNSNEQENYESVRYEGYGPYGIAIMVDTLTDNRNRTAGDIRSTFTKRGGNLGTDGSVSYLFSYQGILSIPKNYDEEKIMELALNNDALDFDVTLESFDIITSQENFIKTKEALEKEGITDFLISEIRYIPNNTVALDSEKQEKIYNLIEALEDLDDVLNVYHNMEE